jgi:glycosyltransferase involved in cell wall biosynthesis
MKHKVLHVIDSLDLGGAQTLLLDIVRHADLSHFDIQVACMHGYGVFVEDFENAGIKVHSLSRSKWPPHYISNLFRLNKSFQPDILHFHLFGSNLIAKPLAALLGKRRLVVHDHCNDAGRKNPLLLFADALTNRVSSKVIAVAESIRSFLICYEGIDRDRVITLPNGVDVQAFVPASETDKQDARKALGISTGAIVIGGVGRLIEQKNFVRFLEVAAHVLKKTPNVIFVIAGTGPQFDLLRERAVRLNISNHVRFLGHVSDRIVLYQALDVLLITSDFEGTPMVLLEAMASGVPVVSQSLDGIGEVCTNTLDAMLVATGDESGLVTAVNRLLADEKLAKGLSENARKTILDRYDIKKLVRKIEAVYEDVLHE